MKYRPDIDGLRAIAVLFVVGYHAFPDLIKGGFIGVDIFFVISGYLISIIIFENLDKGTFSFSEFYSSRIRRIFPALLLVLTACIVFGWFVLFADEYKQLGKHIAGGAGFASNFILLNEAGYFDNIAETKPLLHLWSLGIEEQFYIIWPLLLWFAWKRKFNLLTITIVVAVATFILNLKGVKHDMAATFYLPQTRFWELLSGSLLAWFTLYNKDAFTGIKSKIDAWLSRVVCGENQEGDVKTLTNVLSFVGLFLLLYGLWRINKELSFPGMWALVPVLGTALIITAGSKAWVNRTILSNKIAIWFGLISFPLYLWHWPILSFARIVDGEVPNHNIRTAAVALSVVFALFTYTFVERPMRFGNYSKSKVTVLILLMTIVGFIGYNIYDRNGLEFRSVASVAKINSSAFVKPNVDNLISNCKKIMGNEYPGHCLASHSLDRFSDFDIYFLGDSHSEALTYGFNDDNLKYISLGRGGCLPFLGVDFFNDNSLIKCQLVFFKAFDHFRSNNQQKSIAIISARYAYYVEETGYGDFDLKHRPPGPHHIEMLDEKSHSKKILKGIEAFTLGFVNTLSVLTKSFDRVIVVLQVPELGFDPRDCISRPFRIRDTDCYVARNDVVNRQEKYRKVIKNFVSNFSNVIVYDPLDLFCSDFKCFAVHGNTMLYRDDDHISVAGARIIINDMRSKGLLR